MTVIAGYDGQFDWGGIIDSDVTYHTHSWSLDVTGDMLDVTDFTSAGWREFIAGLKGWSGSVELYTDSANGKQVVPSDVGTSAALRLYFNSTDYAWGKAYVSGWSAAVAVDGVETQTVNFQGTSDLFWTAA